MVICLAALAAGDVCAAAASKPNVLLLFSDQHNADVMGCSGHSIVKTPNLDRLAAQGVRFTRAYCQDAICVPSRTALMAGLYPRTTGCLDNGDSLPPQAGLYPLQQAFKAAGYRTGCFGKRHLPRPTLAAGWDRSATVISPRLDPSDERDPWCLAKAAENPTLYRRYIAYYFAQVTEVDHYIGEVLAELDALGLRDNTIVIYASDHGDFVARHGMIEKCAVSHNVYEETLRVPLIVSWPSHFQEGAVRDSLAELIDIYPTLSELIGLPRPSEAPRLAGQSLVPVLTEGKPTGRMYAISENWSQVSVITGRYKLGVWLDPTARYAQRDFRKRFPDMLFDREKDPQELVNLAGKPESAAIEKQLRACLAEWMAKTSDAGKNEVARGVPKAPARKN